MALQYPRNASIRQWHWEEAVNLLRNEAPESILETHWKTTGNSPLDATARAHIGEWAVFDQPGKNTPSQPTSIIDALVCRALHAEPWDLYSVESIHEDTMSVRGLRDQRGYRIGWLEGRTPPPVHSTIALRLIHLDPPGIYASTLPLVFGTSSGSASVIMALLRAFGASKSSTWQVFMRKGGSRIVLEHALTHLQHRSQSEEVPEPLRAMRQLDRSFSELEAAFFNHCSVPRDITLADGRHGWVEDLTGGPHLIVFKSRDHWNQYREASLRSAAHPVHSGGGVEWCRAHRIPPAELHPVEWELAHRAGLTPERDGVVRLQRRNKAGIFQNPSDEDQRAIQRICHLLSERSHSRVA